MIVVSDTTPIISPLKINQLDLLQKLFQEVLIPRAVFEELTVNQVFKEEVKKVRECSFIRVVSVNQESSVKLLQRVTGLDRGESEAIIYMDENQGRILLMDEAKGRQVARQMGLKIMGTLGILLESYNEELLNREEVITCLDIMRKSGRHISETLYRQLIEKMDQ